MPFSVEEIWRRIFVVHNAAKALYLFAEEQGPGFKRLLQPDNEWKNSAEHIIRAKGRELNLTPAKEGQDNAKYIYDNLDAALGHEYRAFYDTCDWVSICFREMILNDLKVFDHETINAALPNYYSEIRPRIEKISQEISMIRCAKDIGDGEDILLQINKYKSLVEEIVSLYSDIRTKIPSLIDYKASRKKTALGKKVYGIITLILAAGVGAFFEHLFHKQ